MPTIGRHVSKLSGYAPTLPTPFTDQGDVDGVAFEHFCDLQIRAGACALSANSRHTATNTSFLN